MSFESRVIFRKFNLVIRYTELSKKGEGEGEGVYFITHFCRTQLSIYLLDR
jgi:hypothetical protein